MLVAGNVHGPLSFAYGKIYKLACGVFEALCLVLHWHILESLDPFSTDSSFLW